MQPDELIEKMNNQELTKEERIEKLEQEVLTLKEEIKRTRKANVWKKVKNKFESDFNNFNWMRIETITDYKNKKIEHKTYMNENYHTSQAIGTLVRIILQKKGLNYLEESDMEKAEKITKEILEIMKTNKN